MIVFFHRKNKALRIASNSNSDLCAQEEKAYIHTQVDGSNVLLRAKEIHWDTDIHFTDYEEIFLQQVMAAGLESSQQPQTGQRSADEEFINKDAKLSTSN